MTARLVKMKILLILSFLVLLIPEAQAYTYWWNGYQWVGGEDHARGEWRHHERERAEWCRHHPRACRGW